MGLSAAGTRALWYAVLAGALHVVLVPGQWVVCAVVAAAAGGISVVAGVHIARVAAVVHARAVLSAGRRVWVSLLSLFVALSAGTALLSPSSLAVSALSGVAAVAVVWVFGSVFVVAAWAHDKGAASSKMSAASPRPPRTWPGNSPRVAPADAGVRVAFLALVLCAWAWMVGSMAVSGLETGSAVPLGFAVAVLLVLRVAWDCALWRLDLALTSLIPPR